MVALHKVLAEKLSMANFSIIIPVFNRPDEVSALLKSLVVQDDKDFEVIIVEDGSSISCRKEVEIFSAALDIHYYYKENTGPGLSRNFGAHKSRGDYFIFFDSDCIIPTDYISIIREALLTNFSDAFGGPDRADESFSSVQKAINYSMTSFFTTGGIRGKKKGMEKFHPRSFNMGFSKEVFQKTGGYSAMRFGEDVDLSIRIFNAGYKVQLIEQAFVFHKRRTNFRQFFKQVYNSGIARIHLFKLHPQSLKVVHFFPTLFLLGISFSLILSFFNLLFLLPLILFISIIFFDASAMYKNLKIAALSVLASVIQLSGYGAGFIAGFWNRLILKKRDYKAFSESFYK